MPEDKFYYINMGLEKIIENDSFNKYLPIKPKSRPPQTPPKISARDIMPFVQEILDKLGIQDREVRPASLDYRLLDSTPVDDRIFVGDILVDVQSNEVFKYHYQQLYGDVAIGLLGYALHYFQPKEARVRDGPLNGVMRTTGHELGHLFTHDLLSWIDEESKAYAFELAWCKAIQDHNIADLRDKMPNLFSYNEAWQTVKSLVQGGHDPLQLYWEIANSEISKYEKWLGSLTKPFL